MESVYMQQPLPTNLTGVPVSLYVVDANGNYRSIGTTTSDGYGTFSLTWTPDISGDYKVIANFAGTHAYYGSTSATSFHAVEAHAAPTAQPAVQQEPLAMYIAGATAAIIVAIALAAVVIVMMVKKRA
jgi:hypothetical protein